MYATRWCPYCVAARRLLDSLGVRFEEIDVGGRPDLRAEMEQESGRYTVPQIWIGSRHVGGFDDLDALNRRGVLVPMLEQASSGVPAGSE
jgi:glutaredoxin 3